MSDTENNQDQQGSNEPTAAVPAMAEWSQQGTVTSWINMLEMYNRDSKFKWRNLRQLKRKGFKVGLDVKDRFPEVYALAIKAVDLVGIPEQTKMEECNQTVKELVRIFKQLAKLIKNFRSVYSPTKESSEVMNYLAMINPDMFQIRKAGSSDTGYSATIKIVNVLTATEVNADHAVAKSLVSTKVLQFMMQLSKMVVLRVAPVIEPELPRADSQFSTCVPILAVSDFLQPLSVQSVDFDELAENQNAQIEIMAHKLVANVEKSILLPTESSVNSKSQRYFTI